MQNYDRKSSIKNSQGMLKNPSYFGAFFNDLELAKHAHFLTKNTENFKSLRVYIFEAGIFSELKIGNC